MNPDEICLTEPTDSRAHDPLVIRAQAGDESAFADLFERHRREIRVHCYRMLGSYTDAEDLTQETFLRSWRRLATFEGRSTFRAWLYKIATNLCLDALKRKPRRYLPFDVVAAVDMERGPDAAPDVAWIEPFPDDLIAGPAANPDEAVVGTETIELAFLAATTSPSAPTACRAGPTRRARLARPRRCATARHD